MLGANDTTSKAGWGATPDSGAAGARPPAAVVQGGINVHGVRLGLLLRGGLAGDLQPEEGQARRVRMRGKGVRRDLTTGGRPPPPASRPKR